MRVTIEGNLTLAEVKELVEAVQRIERHNPLRVVSLFFHEAPHGVENAEEWIDFCKSVGLTHATVVPPDYPAEFQFEGGGSVRLVPQDPKH